MSETTSTNFFQRAIQAIKDFFSGAETEAKTIEEHIANFSDEVANEIKKLTPTAEAIASFAEKDLLPIAESVAPGILKPLIAGLELELPKIITAVVNTGNIAGEVSAEASKPIEQQAADALSALQKSKPATDDITAKVAYAGAVNTIAAAVSGFVTANNGIAATEAELLSTQSAVHQHANAA